MKSDKKELRTYIRSLKKAMPPEEIVRRSQTLCRLVLDTDAYRRAKTIYGYLPFNQEVDLTTLLQQAMADGKQVALPKCYGKDMRFILMDDLSHIQRSSLGSPEPIADSPIATDKTALMILPGLLFDRLGYRIGYGGGYYDRFLAQEPDHPTIGLCFDFQLVDQLKIDDYDIPAKTVFSF